MRIRSIKPEFFLHEGLFNLEKETKLPCRLAFIGLWCAADREGRFKWEPRRLGIQIMPYDSIDFSRVLDALTTRGFVVKYACGADEFGVIPSFLKHQIINNREKESFLPAPPETLENEHLDASGTREARVVKVEKDSLSGREGKGREGKGKEQGKERTRATLEEVQAFCLEKGLTENDGAFMFHKWEGNGWTNGANPIKNWKQTILSWKAGGWLPSQKTGTNGKPKSSFEAREIQETIEIKNFA